VTSQLLYEMGDPRCYIGPDVHRRLHECIRSSRTARIACGSRACAAPRRPTPTRSRSATSTATRRSDSSPWRAPTRSPRRGSAPTSSSTGLALDGVSFADEQKTDRARGQRRLPRGDHARNAEPTPAEVVCCASACGIRTAAKVNRFGMEIVPLVTSGPPGVTGFAGGRPKASRGRSATGRPSCARGASRLA
jgi:hypothetical protein